MKCAICDSEIKENTGEISITLPKYQVFSAKVCENCKNKMFLMIYGIKALAENGNGEQKEKAKSEYEQFLKLNVER